MDAATRADLIDLMARVVPSEGWLELKIEGGVVSGVINLESPGR